MGVVHGLKRDTGVIAVEITVLNQVLDGFNNLEFCQLIRFTNGVDCITFFSRLACSNRASSTVGPVSADE